MRDIDIRLALRKEMASRHSETDTRIVEEMGICQGLARVDLAVLNGRIHGYEIKSERDTLARLSSQADLYGRALEYVTIVASEAHLPEIGHLVPDWWGIWCAQGESVKFTVIREEQRNPGLLAASLVQFLWRDEALRILGERTSLRGLRTGSRVLLWKRLASLLTADELNDLVREQLKSRPLDWLTGPSSKLCGD